MPLPNARTSSYVAALALAAVTIFVFSTLRDYGPESTVRRFHSDLLGGNMGDLQAVTLERLDSPSVKALVGQLGQIYGPGARTPRVARTDPSYRRTNVLVLYDLPGQRVAAMVWVVVKDNRDWKIDASATLNALRNLGG